MKLLKHRLQTLQEAVRYVSYGLESEAYSMELVSEAPRWLRMASRSSYCAYKNVVYVPSVHLQWVSSEATCDRNLATAKLLPWIMCIYDNNEDVTMLTALKHLFNIRYQTHYFLYELQMLRASSHPWEDAIAMGFLVTRKTFLSIFKNPRLNNFISETLTRQKA